MGSPAFYVCMSHILKKVAHCAEVLGLPVLHTKFNKACCVKNRTISRWYLTRSVRISDFPHSSQRIERLNPGYFYMLKQSAIKYSAENATEEQADKLAQETVSGTKKEVKRVFNERENIARKQLP